MQINYFKNRNLLVNRALMTFLVVSISFLCKSQETSAEFAIWEDESAADSTRLEALKHHIWNNVMMVDIDSAFNLADQQLEYATTVNADAYIASAYNTKGALHYLIGTLDSAYHYYSKSLTVNEKIGNNQGIASAQNNIGNVLKEMGLYKEANSYYLKSLTHIEQTDNEKGKTQILSNIGIIYADLGRHDLAIEYYEKSLKIQQKMGFETEMVATYINLGATYAALDQPKKSLDYYEEAYTIAKKLNDPIKIAQVESNLGQYYAGKGLYTRALNYHLSALAYFEKLGAMGDAMRQKLEIAGIYRTRKDYTAAESYGLQALAFAVEEDDLEFMRFTSEELFFIYNESGEYKKALDMLIWTEDMKDTLQNMTVQSAILQQNFQHEYEKQALVDSVAYENKTRFKNEQLKAQTAQLAKEKTQRYALWGGIGLLVIIAGLFIRSNQRKKRDNAIINAQKTEVEAATRHCRKTAFRN